MRFLGFEPPTQLRRGRLDATPKDDDYESLALGATSHIDAILLLTGGPAAGLDLHPVFGHDTGSNLKALFTEATSPNGLLPADLADFSRHQTESHARFPSDEIILDMAIVRQMRAQPIYADGQPTNRLWVTEEKRARLYRLYAPGSQPTRPTRIGNLLHDATLFARVQAHNLGFDHNPRPELVRNTLD